MYFKRLEIHGFKSFADPQVIEFNRGITCIVGPNGSGKSNISDAIRWVLGEQSPKQLRGGKMEEVIFNGTQNRNSRGMAEVTLVIDNSDRALDIEFNEVAVKRRMFRSGESEYLINNNTCRLKDIRQLFMDTGIGVEGYSVIGQGKIADIVNDRPDSRRKIFEESAGIVSYKTRKAESEKKLKLTKNNMERVEDLIKELEGRVETLSSESAKAKEYIFEKDRYTELSVNIILKNIEVANEEANEYKIRISDLKAQADFMEDHINKTELSILDVDQRILNSDKKINEENNRQLEITSSISEYRKESELNQQRLGDLAKEIRSAEDEIKRSLSKIDESENELMELRNKRTDIVSKTRETKNILEEKQRVMQRISGEFGSVDKILEGNNERLFDLHAEEAAKRSEASSLESYKKSLEKRLTELKTDSNLLVREKSVYNRRLKDAEARKNAELKNSERIETETTQTEQRFRDLKILQSNLSKEMNEINIKVGKLEERHKTIEEMELNHEGYSNSVRYILRSGLSGVEGVAADLIEIPFGYETAIETALGATKQNIIVRDDRSAKNAINALKHNKAGRLTFLPISSIEAKKTEVGDEVRNDEGFIGMAVDIVHFNERYRNIFRYLLGRVVIVDNMDTAVRLSKLRKKGLRFVTKEGDIVFSTGAITGGADRYAGAGVLGRKNEISKIMNEVNTLKDELKKKQRVFTDGEKNKERFIDVLSRLNNELHESKIKLTTLKPEIDNCSAELFQIDEKLKKNLLENETAERQIREIEVEIQELIDLSKNARNNIIKVSREVEAVLGDYDEHKKALKKATEDLTQAKIIANEWVAQKDNISVIITRAENEQKSLRENFESVSNKKQRFEREQSHIKSKLSDFDVQLEKLENELRSVQEKIRHIKDRKDSDIKNKAQFADSLREYENERDSYLDNRYRMEIEEARNEARRDNLKEKLWEEFELSYAQALDYKWENFILSTSVKEARDARNRMRSMEPVNLNAIKEFEKVNERYTFLLSERNDISIAANELEYIIEDMDKKMVRRFRDNFEHIEYNFSKIFTELFGGGHAELRLDNDENPLESGIEIVSQPPGKKLQNINLLSGGEKTMTAIALMFAVIRVRPTPFCILDEVEAALDDENIVRFTQYLKKFRETQFALITHQKTTMERADLIYGVTMADEGVSKVISLKLEDPKNDNFVE